MGTGEDTCFADDEEEVEQEEQEEEAVQLNPAVDVTEPISKPQSLPLKEKEGVSNLQLEPGVQAQATIRLNIVLNLLRDTREVNIAKLAVSTGQRNSDLSSHDDMDTDSDVSVRNSLLWRCCKLADNGPT